MKKKVLVIVMSLIIFYVTLGGILFGATELIHAKNIVVYSQTDSRWGNTAYGYGPDGIRATISSAGCGILSYVNAVYYMTGSFIDPIQLAEWSVKNSYRINGVGTSLGLYKAYADVYGTQYGFRYGGSVTNVEDAKNHLQNGGTAIISVPGHLMALVDYDINTGKYLVLDSYKSSNRGTYNGGYRWLTAGQFTGKLTVYGIELLLPTDKACNPVGMLDAVTGNTGSITVSGWAFDEDNVSQALEIHVYIGGLAGSGAPCYRITADKLRSDVGDAYAGVGNYHGYEDTITTNRTGIQDVYVYAINIEGGYTNTFLGSKTVNIKSGSSPVGSFDGIGAGEGYVDVSGWAFDEDVPTTSLKMHVYIGGPAGSGAQGYVISADQLRSDVGSSYPGVGNYHGFSARIETEKAGTQTVYVYAINEGAGGTNQLIGSRNITIKEKPKVCYVESVSIVNANGYLCTHQWIDSVGKSLQLYADVYPKLATNKNVTWSTSNSSVLTVNGSGKVTAVGIGAAYVIATTEDGQHVGKCWIKVGMENIKYGDIDFNDKITATDLSVINQVINGYVVLSDAEKKIVDVDGDGRITTNDRDLINQYIMKEIDEFPVECMLAELRIIKSPSKLEYYKGDALVTTGIELQAIYQNGDVGVVSVYDCDVKVNLQSTGQQRVSITYSKNGISKTAFYYVKVHEIELENISIVQNPYTISYMEGEDVDFSGLKVKAFYTNGTSKFVENYMLYYNQELQVGDNKIDIVYQENERAVSATLNITVISLCDVYGHEWEYQLNEDIGTHMLSCKVCKNESVQKCVLNTVTIDANDTEDGYVEEFCNECGYSQIIEILPSKFTIDENGVLTGYTGNDTEVIIPDSVKGIGYYAFRDCTDITSIVIPDSVTSIGIASFFGCSNLKEIMIPDSVTSIGVGAFYACEKLEEIQIPSTVMTIGSHAFAECTSLKEIMIPDGITAIEDNLFYECRALKKVTMPNSIKSIGEYAFFDCYKLSNITLSKKLETIGDLAFHSCRSLEEVVIPKTVTSIGKDVFLECNNLIVFCFKDSYVNIYAEENDLNYILSDSFSQADVELSASNYVYDGNAKEPKVTVKLKGIELIFQKDYTVSYTDNIEAGSANIIVTGCGNYIGTISKKFSISALSLKDATITLSASSFIYDGTEKRPTITVTLDGKKLSQGTDYEISYSNNIVSGTAAITIIGKGNYTGTISRNYAITAASVKDAKVTLSKTSYSYDGKTKKPSVIVTFGNKKLVKDTDYTVSYKNNKNIGKATVTITGKSNYTGSLTKTFIIKEKKGTTFTSGSYKYKVTSSSAVAFAGLKSDKTTKVSIPKTVKYGDKTFKVTSVADKALKGKTKVTQVTIGANVTTIGANAFAGCTKLSKVTMGANVTSIGASAFKSCTKLSKISIGKKVKTIGASAFEGCKKLSSVTIGSAVTTIGDKAFKNCTSLKAITIPAKVTKIGKQAFYGCKNLKTITIKSTKLNSVGKDALKGINAKAVIKVPKSKLSAYKKLLKGKGQGSKVKIVKY